MAKVIVKEYDTFDAAMKAFKSKCIKENILAEIYSKSFYVSKGEKRRATERAAARKRWIAQQRRIRNSQMY